MAIPVLGPSPLLLNGKHEWGASLRNEPVLLGIGNLFDSCLTRKVQNKVRNTNQQPFLFICDLEKLKMFSTNQINLNMLVFELQISANRASATASIEILVVLEGIRKVFFV